MSGILTSSKILHQPPGLVKVDSSQPYGSKTLYLAFGNAIDVDLVHGQNLSIAPGTVTTDQRGTVRSFNGSQQQNKAMIWPAAVIPYNDIVVAARVRRTATQAGSPGQAFGIFDSTSQSGFGVGFDTSGNIGCGWLSSSGAGLIAYSSGSLNVWYDVYVAIRLGTVFSSWINGVPATTNQDASISGTNFSTKNLNEICIGAQHRSSGYLRQFKGDIEWVSLLYYPSDSSHYGFSDSDAAALYASGYPYNCLKA